MTADGAHGYDYLIDNPHPSTTLRRIRRATVAIAMVLAAAALILMTIGGRDDRMHTWNLGCTLLLAAGGALLGWLCIQVCQLLVPVILRRLDDVEAGERLIAEYIDRMADASGDELRRHRRRRGDDGDDEDDQGLR